MYEKKEQKCSNKKIMKCRIKKNTEKINKKR